MICRWSLFNWDQRQLVITLTISHFWIFHSFLYHRFLHSSSLLFQSFTVEKIHKKCKWYIENLLSIFLLLESGYRFFYSNLENLLPYYFSEKNSDYHEIYLPTLHFFLTFLLLVQINFQFLAGTGKIWNRARILAIALPINIILNYILIKQYWVEWSALAVGLSWIPLWYLSFRATRIYSSGFSWIPFIRNMAYVLVCGFMLYTIIPILQISDSTRLWSLLIIWIAMIVNIVIFVIGNFGLLINAWEIIRNNK